MPEQGKAAQADVVSDLGFDPEVLREKYRAERDRRVRDDGERQYVEIAGDLAHFANYDPWAPDAAPREASSAEIDVAIIGAGYSGMLLAARLREAGIDNLRIIDSSADFGGTWYWNRYPGAQCDVESYCYMPLLEETGYIPKEKYSFQPELFEHSQRIGKRYGLYELALFQTMVEQMRWDESISRWIVSTNRDDKLRARFVVVCPGITPRPKLPGIPGIQDFKGHSFHTSRWDYEYTGGDHSGDLDKLADKKVAIIGTGASAIQAVPYLGASAQQLYVFQRTPSSVAVRGNKPTDPEWANSLTPGWQQHRRENFTKIWAGEDVEDLVDDGWTDIYKNLKVMAAVGITEVEDPEALAEFAEIADFKKMNEIRARVDAVVKDPKTAELLKPWYRQLCKRPCFNDQYLPTFNRPNVTLVDVSDSHGVDRITENGIVANGVEYPVDCIIFSTGFETGSSWRRHFNYDIIGRGGKSLFDHWSKRLRTLHGHSTHGFPNWFFIGQGQNAGSANFTQIVDDQAKHLAYIMGEVQRRGAQSVEATAEAEESWVTEVTEKSTVNLDFFDSCTPGYYNNEGKFRESTSAFFTDIYVPGANVFNAMLADWRAAGDLAGLEIRP